jgi:hypothetical protein
VRDDPGPRDDADRDGPVGTRLHAGRRFTDSEARRAHVAFPHDAAFRGILRHIIRTFEHTILAADALVIEVSHDAGVRLLFIRAHRTAFEARGLEAVMACGGDGLLIWRGARAAMDRAGGPPDFIVIESV